LRKNVRAKRQHENNANLPRKNKRALVDVTNV
jgi:hypothetical protein